jgi:thiamine-monophosphate kinase
MDEFAWIERLKPLTRGDPRALGLADDAAIVPGLAGHDLVISKDALVQGVHFLADEDTAVVARRLLRTSLSDLAAKGARPFGYFLLASWPAHFDDFQRAAFIRGLAEDGEAFGIALLGGDTVATPGPLTVCATVLGWAPSGRAILRSGARAGDRLVVCGAIGDGWLGLMAARGQLDDPQRRLTGRYRLPTPLLGLEQGLQTFAHASADVSDGLLADSARVAAASGLALQLDLARQPLSDEGRGWIDSQPDAGEAALALATGGDDYAIVCAVDPGQVQPFLGFAAQAGIPAADMGEFTAGDGVRAFFGARRLALGRLGWRHA